MTGSVSVIPDYLFEVSWEVCNKVGGIHTVLSTKAHTMLETFGDNYIAIGPDLIRENHGKGEFIEDPDLFLSWKEQAQIEGIKIRTGKWKDAHYANVILVDFTPLYKRKDEIFTTLWLQFHLDSLTGQWDYIEPALFGYAAGMVIESFCRFHLPASAKVVAHFHEWMTGAGILYLNKNTPSVGTAFTTHATVLGRAIAGSNLPLYSKLEEYNPALMARQFNVIAKNSLEQVSALNTDAFSTVSKITAKECVQFLTKAPDFITPNGFENRLVPADDALQSHRQDARQQLLSVAQALLGYPVAENPLLILKSGRYEFHNKGIDVLIESLGQLNRHDHINRDILVFIMVPAANRGPRKELLDRLLHGDSTPHPPEILTHYLENINDDPVMKALNAHDLLNSPDSKVKVFFVPTYLNGFDGVFNKHYYELLMGFDLSVFPSYYEPWGYTPLESIAFSVPTVTTSLTGFGAWIQEHHYETGAAITVLQRDDRNIQEVVPQLVETITRFAAFDAQTWRQTAHTAREIASHFQWEKLIPAYHQMWTKAIENASKRIQLMRASHEMERPAKLPGPVPAEVSRPRWRRMLVTPELPETLKPLKELANNIWWAWHEEVAELFSTIDTELWLNHKKNPVAMLESLPYSTLKRLEKNRSFMQKLQAVYKKFRDYIEQPHPENSPSIAYFCMEYGLHPVLRLYSGGLGILAGDHLKEASDMNLNMVAIGLLYRYGYFSQQLSMHGDQIAIYKSQKFSYLPVIPVRDEKGNWLKISIPFPGRTVYAKIWKIQVGRVPLYLLDSDIDENNEEDRSITYQLYGGDIENRIKQEILLGIGGIRLLELLGIHPDIFHCNEGHAAFLNLERLRIFIEKHQLSFQESLEAVKASTLFTTHTPVPAGHDTFSEDLIRTYLSNYCDILNISWDDLIALGKTNPANKQERFSMSYLASRCAVYINGVSKIHGEVTRQIFQSLWQGFMPGELDNIRYVTNGVHYDTWTSNAWRQFHQKHFGKGYKENPAGNYLWQRIKEVDDATIWYMRQQHKKGMLGRIKKKLEADMTNRHENPKFILQLIHNLDAEALIIGFARRFATYKRAHLLFNNLDRLKAILNNPDHPVRVIFAGKAHPNDHAGQELIKKIFNLANQPPFFGKIFFLENYEMDIAEWLVQGVDVWLNTPTRPMEASGTSGMKAALNGVLNLSVLDGWWAEGYQENAGWALPREKTYDRQDLQDELDAEMIYSILEKEVIPAYYERDANEIPSRWVEMMKNTIADIAPNFTTRRMLNDYKSRFYIPIFNRWQLLRDHGFDQLKSLVRWKNHILENWEKIKVYDLETHDAANQPLPLGKEFNARIALVTGDINPDELKVEVIFIQRKDQNDPGEIVFKKALDLIESKAGKAVWQCSFPVTHSGVYEFGFRILPQHALLPHHLDFNLVKWI